jgi:hypothetical protein
MGRVIRRQLRTNAKRLAARRYSRTPVTVPPLEIPLYSNHCMLAFWSRRETKSIEQGTTFQEGSS